MKPVIEDIYFYDFVKRDESKYFANSSFNALYKMNSDYTCEYMSAFPTEKNNARDLFQGVTAYGDDLFFIPSGGSSIICYSLKSNRFEILDNNQQESICYVQTIDNCAEALLIPLNLDTPFMFLDMRNKTLKRLNVINEGIKKALGNSIKFCTAYPAILFNNNVYLVVEDTNELIKIKWGEWGVSVYAFQADVHLKSINVIEGIAYITCKEDKILQWDFDHREAIWKTPPVDAKSSFPYLRLIYVNEEYILVPGHENVIWKATQMSTEWKRIALPNEFKRKTDKLLFFSYDICDTNTVALFPRSGNGTIIYHADSDTFDFISMKPGDREVKLLETEWAKDVLKESIIDEGVIDLSDYISALAVLN